jgi:hypothetical protein
MESNQKCRKADFVTKPLDQCSTKENDDGFCERDRIMALNAMNAEFTVMEFNIALLKARRSRDVSRLIDLGIVEMSWNEAKQDFEYRVKQ